MSVTEAMAVYVDALKWRDGCYSVLESARADLSAASDGHKRASELFSKAKSDAELAGIRLLSAIETSVVVNQ